jgi:hypothetical protein
MWRMHRQAKLRLLNLPDWSAAVVHQAERLRPKPMHLSLASAFFQPRDTWALRHRGSRCVNLLHDELLLSLQKHNL